MPVSVGRRKGLEACDHHQADPSGHPGRQFLRYTKNELIVKITMSFQFIIYNYMYYDPYKFLYR